MHRTRSRDGGPAGARLWWGSRCCRQARCLWRLPPRAVRDAPGPEQQLPARSARERFQPGFQPRTGLRAPAASPLGLAGDAEPPHGPRPVQPSPLGGVPRLCAGAQPLPALFPCLASGRAGARVGSRARSCLGAALPRPCGDADRTSPEESCSEGSERILTCLSARGLEHPPVPPPKPQSSD